MRVEVRYHTRSGNTKKLAMAVADAAGVAAQDLSIPLEEKADILFLGSSVYGADVDDAVKSFIADNAGNIGCIVNISTAALLSSTYKQVSRLAEKHGIPMAKDEYHCRGAFTIMHRSRPDGDDLLKAAQFAKAVIKKYTED